MMVTFVSQCEKKALTRTRRVLDAFANRIGDNTWQTVITQEGLQAVKKLLRKTASKNTAVSCHWIRSRARSELVWVVGNRYKFSPEGIVPVNHTKLNLSHKEWENGWLQNEVIVLASSIAGLFHDFGKSNDLFQAKLNGVSVCKGEPYRHEWVSLRLFEALVENKTDKEWLSELTDLGSPEYANKLDQHVCLNLFKDNTGYQNPFDQLAPFAQLIAWLVVSHHRLPLLHVGSGVDNYQMNSWLTKSFNCHWNSKNAEDLSQYNNEQLIANWQFSSGTPLISQVWQQKAKKLGERALNCTAIFDVDNWLEQRFVSHMARLSLMLADHYYSSLPAQSSKVLWRDNHYQAYANTDRTVAAKQNVLKQKLDEHNIGVAQNAQRFSQNLPALKPALPAIDQHKLFSRSSNDAKYRWQNKAFKTAQDCAEATAQQGFFGVNMASTGKGKTIANARIMYGLADEEEGCRFSVALGLRTLTLQTGDAYRDLLKLGDDDLAVLVGSSAVQTLHKLESAKLPENKLDTGSESAEDLAEQWYISYDGQIYDGRLKHWLAGNPKLEKLISAPIVISTIDHLMPATESKRGGKQIAPMLRLLTADLVLDEPDDFNLEDLPALCRLVNWSGMLGGRVLLSSATLPPSLIQALFEAYKSGREQFNTANFYTTPNKGVVCAWFDEYKSQWQALNDKNDFIATHNQFVTARVKKLKSSSTVLRKGSVVEVGEGGNEASSLSDLYSSVASTIQQQIYSLHNSHHVCTDDGRKVSLGVVRMANIEPMLAVVKASMAMPVDDAYSFHICIYHSQFPLALRSYKESRLDKALTRHDTNQLWQQVEIKQALEKTNTKNNIFIVFGTAVVEVGRDHDYDWAIAEPSSLRSIIQLAGRVQRHRQVAPRVANMSILNRNIRALKGGFPAYWKPGFETQNLPLAEHELSNLLGDELNDITAIPRIIEPAMKKGYFLQNNKTNQGRANAVNSFVAQEHRALRITLDKLPDDNPDCQEKYYRNNKVASFWWQSNAAWNAEFIRQTEFRASLPQQEYCLRFIEGEPLNWCQKDETKYPVSYVLKNTQFKTDNIPLARGCYWWFNTDAEQVYKDLAEKLQLSVEQVSNQFGVISLRTSNNDNVIQWHWHEQCGVYEIKEDKEQKWS